MCPGSENISNVKCIYKNPFVLDGKKNIAKMLQKNFYDILRTLGLRGKLKTLQLTRFQQTHRIKKEKYNII